MKRLILIAVLVMLVIVAAAPMPQATVRTGSVTRQFYSSGELVAWTRLRLSATWTTKDGKPCVQVTSAGVSHWTKDGWGKWQRGATNVSPSGCVNNVTRYTSDKWLSPPGIPDYRVYLEGAVNSMNPGKFYWENVVTQ